MERTCTPPSLRVAAFDSWALDGQEGDSKRMYGTASVLGAGLALLLAFSEAYVSRLVPEWAAQLSWLVLTTLGAAVCGYVKPERAWRWGSVIIGVQPACVLFIMAVVGELSEPTSSTGGLVAVAIFTVFAMFVSPLPIFASHAVGWLRARALDSARGAVSASE